MATAISATFSRKSALTLYWRDPFLVVSIRLALFLGDHRTFVHPAFIKLVGDPSILNEKATPFDVAFVSNTVTHAIIAQLAANGRMAYSTERCEKTPPSPKTL